MWFFQTRNLNCPHPFCSAFLCARGCSTLSLIKLCWHCCAPRRIPPTSNELKEHGGMETDVWYCSRTMMHDSPSMYYNLWQNIIHAAQTFLFKRLHATCFGEQTGPCKIHEVVFFSNFANSSWFAAKLQPSHYVDRVLFSPVVATRQVTTIPKYLSFSGWVRSPT